MSAALLATKLYLPRPRPRSILRPRLIARLNEGLHRKLTLISAPAGFGKSSLVGEWLADCGRPVAWLSLDAGDSDSARFLTYLVAALRTIAPGVGESVLGMLRSSPPPPPEAILTELLNELATLPDQVFLVLDDYHAIDAGAVDDALAFLVEHLPPQLHLVIATREDPPLPLARLRVRGQLTELRAADLRFTTAEAAAFLTDVMSLNLSGEDVAALEDRTEGWIAGLQLAALSIQGRADIPAFIRAFAGDHRYIVDYLVEEVLQHQSEAVRSFLLQTALLDRLHGSLCDAVTGQVGGGARLEALHRGNFFVVSLDDQRQWYRYHHLFTEVLRAQLQLEQPELVATLHRRAGAWYEQHGFVDDAIRHALAAGDYARAADLVEMAWTGVRRSRQDATLLGWLKTLPEGVLHVRPVLGVVYAHVLLSSGVFEGVEQRLHAAEQWLDTTAHMSAGRATSTAQKVVVDVETFGHLPEMIAIARAGMALARGDVPATITYAKQALERASEDDHHTRGGAAGFLGLAFWTSGDLVAAHQTYANAVASLQQAGNIADAVNGAITLAGLRLAQGRLREAARTYQWGVQLAMEQGTPLPRGTADMYVGLSEIAREQNDLEAASQHLLHSQNIGEHAGFPQNRYRRRIATARLRQIQGDLDGALELLDEAERLYMSDFSPNVRPIAALKVRVWLDQGRLNDALKWVRARGVSAQDELSYLREFEHITLARVLLARAQHDRADRSLHEALDLLQRLLDAAEAGERMGSVLEILVVQALAHQTQGDVPAALVALERALTLAEPEGYVRLFADEGPSMAALLAHIAKRHARNDPIRVYAEQLLSACLSEPERQPRSSVEGTAVLRAAHAHAHALAEPLSEREREVLRLLKTDLSGPDIARELMMSLNTLRTHTKNIYDKLGVNSRRAAVHRAAELNLD
jgi:LuxR family transcriptional regulator, maltose regulon positive regulatory protein